MSTPFIGQIETFAFNYAPKGWAQCNGQLLPINQNQPLFSLLGTMYGGDGRVNFALPDLRGRVPISMGNQNTTGSRGGEEFHTLSQSEMPAHNHMMFADGTTAAANNKNTPGSAGSSVLGNSGGIQNPGGPFDVSIYSSASANGTLAPGVVSNTGGSQPHENRMPSLVINMCIALVGIFPSRD
jgi:microcystin-dependent protein